jgi:hypothetical protein
MRSNHASRFAGAAGLVAILAVPIYAPATEAACEKVYASGETMATGPASFAGTAWTSLGNIAIGDLGDRQVTVAVLGLKETGQGLLATTSHTFVGPDGSFTTTDNARLVELSPGLYRLDTQASITDGGWGHLSIDGLVDFRTGYARWFAQGELCRQ